MFYPCSSFANFQDIPFHVLPHQLNKAVDKHRGLGSGTNSKHIWNMHFITGMLRKGSRGYLPLSSGSCQAKRALQDPPSPLLAAVQLFGSGYMAPVCQ